MTSSDLIEPKEKEVVVLLHALSRTIANIVFVLMQRAITQRFCKNLNPDVVGFSHRPLERHYLISYLYRTFSD